MSVAARARSCEAYTKSFRACRGYADHGTGLCALHVDFYRTRWLPFLFRNYDPLTWGPANTSSLEKALAIAKHPAISETEWPAERVEAALLEHAAQPVPGRAIQSKCVYEVLCLARRIRPSALPEHWTHMMQRYWEILSFMVSSGVNAERLEMHVRKYYLVPFVQSMDDLALFYERLPLLLYRLPVAVAANSLATLVPMLLEMLHELIGSDLSLCNKDAFVAAAAAAYTKNVAFCAASTRAWVQALLGEQMSHFRFVTKELQAAERVRRRVACDRFKEELMMRTWHPDRVLRLLEAGIDVEDM